MGRKEGKKEENKSVFQRWQISNGKIKK